jgi:hypothetical protein
MCEFLVEGHVSERWQGWDCVGWRLRWGHGCSRIVDIDREELALRADKSLASIWFGEALKTDAVKRPLYKRCACG